MVDAVVVQPAATDTSAHDAAMIQKADAAMAPPATPAAPATDRPTWLPEKFKSAEDLAKAYSELEQKLGTQTPPAAKTDTQPTPANAPQQGSEKIDFNAIEQELVSNDGKLSDATISKLEKAGFDKAQVDQWIAGQQALADQLAQQAFSVAGGKEQYQAMLNWAKANLRADEVDAFNAATMATPEALMLAVHGLHARYVAANGTNPELTKPNTVNGPAVSSFESWAQVTEAMQDPRYARDPAYRADVERKLAQSKTLM